MSDIEITREHDRSVEELHQKADELFSEQERVSSVDWNDDNTRASIDGQGFSGELIITEETVTGRLELSMMAKAFKGTIEDQLTRQVDDMLS